MNEHYFRIAKLMVKECREAIVPSIEPDVQVRKAVVKLLQRTFCDF